MKRWLVINLIGIISLTQLTVLTVSASSQIVTTENSKLYYNNVKDMSTINIAEYESRDIVEQTGNPQATQEEYELMLQENEEVYIINNYGLEDNTNLEITTFINEDDVLVSYVKNTTPTQQEKENLAEIDEANNLRMEEINKKYENRPIDELTGFPEATQEEYDNMEKNGYYSSVGYYITNENNFLKTTIINTGDDVFVSYVEEVYPTNQQKEYIASLDKRVIKREYRSISSSDLTAYYPATEEEYNYMVQTDSFSSVGFYLDSDKPLKITTFLNEEGQPVTYVEYLASTEEEAIAKSEEISKPTMNHTPPTEFKNERNYEGNWDGVSDYTYSNYIFYGGVGFLYADTPFSMEIYSSDGSYLYTEVSSYSSAGEYYKIAIPVVMGEYYIKINHIGDGSASNSHYVHM